jgi:hypothetical protein
MKELQERIEECLARLKELPKLIRAEREKMNGKAAIEELKTRLKGLWLEYLTDAANMVEMNESTKKEIKVYPNERTREGFALSQSKTDAEYQQISEEIKRFEHQRNTATMNHEALVKEHSGLISTVDVLREMLKVELYSIQRQYKVEDMMSRLQVQKKTAEAEVDARAIVQQWIQSGKLDAKMKEASNVG